MKILLIPILTLFLSISALGQSKKDQIKALKVAFITEKLELSEKEAQKFWPIYNTYDDTTRRIKQKNIHSIRREIRKNIETLTDEQALKFLTTLGEAEKQLVIQRKKLTEKLKGVISPKKIILLRISEDDFNRKIFEQFKKRHKTNKKKN
ncbi:hypothetical protein A8C32_17540 [Flavivirga aquatica]|uniref:Sensor of ECF-type sigma factor n=1 Tax=Flavivirga aquatica TaxID=1849968 RepID=A0A1E5T8A3_9FLAO|nr:hypothetical protein [Flavivirga aquatica]OEK07600.1 hypothetical protein A8C32_17540 [Flavivirga aquatica]